MSELSWRKVERLFELEQLLQVKKRSVSQLAQIIHQREIEHQSLTLESARRNLRRDLEFLGREKFARGIEKSDDQIPLYHIPKKLALDKQQVLAVHTIARLFDHHAPTQDEIYHRIIESLTDQLPEHIRMVLESSAKQQKTQRPQQLSRTLEKINKAWVERRQVKFKYLKPGGSGEWRDNTVSIYFCEISRTNLDHYIIGYEHDFHQGIRTFKLSRIDQAEPQNSTYEIPPDFDPAKYLGNAWGIIGDSDGQGIRIRLRFAASVLHRLDEGGYPNMETLEQHQDGSRTIEVKAGTNKNGIPLEVLVWARSWGPNVEIISPANLRQIWLEDAKEILRRYAKDTHD